MPYSPNPLNRFATYSYRIRIFMYPELVTSYGDYQTGVMVADSASTADYNIQSVEQVHHLGFNNARHAFTSEFTIQIAETNGITFYQTLAAAAGITGVSNFISNAKYAIEISFPGRDDGNGIGTEGPFIIPVMFLKVDTQITERGSLYNITAVEISTNSYSYNLGNIKRTVSFNASTVGQAVEEFQRVVNQQEAAELETNENMLSRNEYIFEFDSSAAEWADWPIEFNEENPGSDDVLNTRQFQIVAGSSIQEFFTRIMTNAAEYKSYPVITGGYSAPDPAGSPNNFDLKVLYKIIGTEEDIFYDPLAGRYTKKVTYRIRKHISPELIVNSEEVSHYQNNPAAQTTRVQHLLGLGLLKKRYDYLYTGKNTEVINLDIKIENSYYLISPQASGQIFSARLSGNTALSRTRINEQNSTIQPEDRGFGITVDARRRAADISERLLDTTLSADERSLLISMRNSYISELASGLPQGQFMRYTHLNDAVEQSVVNAPVNDNDTQAVLRFGASMQNLYNSGDLLEIEMQIRGDPYWLGLPNSLYDLGLPTDAADYEMGANYFFLKINLPSPNGPSNDFLITGLYRVISVISEYRNGKFIQYLKAYRDVIINTDTVISTLESGDGVAPNTSPNAPLDGSRTSPNAGSANPTVTDPAGSGNQGDGLSTTTTGEPVGNTGENGRLPVDSLTQIAPNHYLREDAAAAYERMVSSAAADGIRWGIKDSYRTYDEQVILANRLGLYKDGGLAAEPGQSNHGWGLALDLDLDSQSQQWINQNAGNYGFNTISREPWHWEYNG